MFGDKYNRIKLWQYLRRARYILETDGFINVIKRGFIYFRPRVFSYRCVYLYETLIEDWDEADFLPRIQNVDSIIISSNEDADKVAETYADVREIQFNAREYLNIGAVAACLFVGRDLVHISWIAFTEEAKRVCDSIPYKVNFSRGQACTGGTFTYPAYRGQNLMVYGCYKKFQYAKENGIRSIRNSMRTDNIASQKVYSKFNGVPYAKAYYLKFLMFKYLRETPIV